MSPELAPSHEPRVETDEAYQQQIREYVKAISIADLTDQHEAHRLRVELAALRTNGTARRRPGAPSSQIGEEIV